jgi:DNA-binding MarR family transcriptional regulator
MKVDQFLTHLNTLDEINFGFRRRINECTFNEFRLMSSAKQDGSLILNQLSEERSIFQQGIGRMAKNMQDRGLIRLVRCRDKRAKRIELTAKGIALEAECRAVVRNLIKKIIEEV